MFYTFCIKMPEKWSSLPSFQALQAFLGVKHSLPACCSFSLSQVLKGFKNRWMESKVGWGSLCVIECQEASWLALIVSCTWRKGH